jgi:hypothetical protein
MTITGKDIILIDAVASGSSGLLMLAARSILYPYFGLQSPFVLDVVAVGFLAYAATIVVPAIRNAVVPRTTLMTVAAANALYVVASAGVLIAFWPELDPIGRALIAAAAVIVEAFATLQFTVARRAPGRAQLV